MASTYSPSLRLELMATGDQSGTWGDTTNTNLGMLLEQAITGYLSKAMADANQTLTNLNGASDEARNMVLNLTGALTAGRNVVVPTANKVYLVRNSTTGNFAVTVKTGAGTGVAVYPGQTRWVACDGTNVVDYDVPKFIDSQFLLADDADVTKLAAFQLSGLTTGQTRTYTMVDRSGTLLLSGGTLDTQLILQDDGDTTKQAQFNASGLPTATTRTYDLPYYSGTLGLVSDIRGQIYGLTLSNNAVDIVNDIDIAAGSAVDSTGTVSMLLASSLTKRLDAAWAVGSGNGWLDTGAVANTTYYAYLIRRPDTGVVDSVASISPTAPTLPANYTQYAYIGPVMRVSAAIVQFVQRLDDFTYTVGPSTDRSSTAAQANSLLSLVVPNGISVYPKLTIQMTCVAPVNADTTLADGDRSIANVQVAALFDTVGNSTTRSVVTSFRTNTSAQIRYAVTLTSGALGGQNVVQTWGFIDPRGRKA